MLVLSFVTVLLYAQPAQGASYREVKAQRHAIRVLRREVNWQAKRTDSRPIRSKQIGWRIGLLKRANTWTRHVLRVYRSRATHVTIERPQDWKCLARYESGSNWHMTPPASGGNYWGGLQMDPPFQHAYGSDMIARHHGGLASVWTPYEQMVVAQRAWQVRGYEPWPQTSVMCGLR